MSQQKQLKMSIPGGDGVDVEETSSFNRGSDKKPSLTPSEKNQDGISNKEKTSAKTQEQIASAKVDSQGEQQDSTQQKDPKTSTTELSSGKDVVNGVEEPSLSNQGTGPSPTQVNKILSTQDGSFNKGKKSTKKQQQSIANPKVDNQSEQQPSSPVSQQRRMSQQKQRKMTQPKQQKTSMGAVIEDDAEELEVGEGVDEGTSGEEDQGSHEDGIVEGIRESEHHNPKIHRYQSIMNHIPELLTVHSLDKFWEHLESNLVADKILKALREHNLLQQQKIDASTAVDNQIEQEQAKTNTGILDGDDVEEQLLSNDVPSAPIPANKTSSPPQEAISNKGKKSTKKPNIKVDSQSEQQDLQTVLSSQQQRRMSQKQRKMSQQQRKMSQHQGKTSRGSIPGEDYEEQSLAKEIPPPGPPPTPASKTSSSPQDSLNNKVTKSTKKAQQTGGNNKVDNQSEQDPSSPSSGDSSHPKQKRTSQQKQRRMSQQKRKASIGHATQDNEDELEIGTEGNEEHIGENLETDIHENPDGTGESEIVKVHRHHTKTDRYKSIMTQIPEEALRSLAAFWENLESNFVAELKRILIALREHHDNLSQYSDEFRATFQSTLEHDDDRGILILEFQEKFNAIPLRVRNDFDIKGQLHNRVDELLERVEAISEEKYAASKDNIYRQLNDGFVEQEAAHLTSLFGQLITAEGNRHCARIQFLNEFYRLSGLGLPDMRLKWQHLDDIELTAAAASQKLAVVSLLDPISISDANFQEEEEEGDEEEDAEEEAEEGAEEELDLEEMPVGLVPPPPSVVDLNLENLDVINEGEDNLEFQEYEYSQNDSEAQEYSQNDFNSQRYSLNEFEAKKNKESSISICEHDVMNETRNWEFEIYNPDKFYDDEDINIDDSDYYEQEDDDEDVDDKQNMLDENDSQTSMQKNLKSFTKNFKKLNEICECYDFTSNNDTSISLASSEKQLSIVDKDKNSNKGNELKKSFHRKEDCFVDIVPSCSPTSSKSNEGCLKSDLSSEKETIDIADEIIALESNLRLIEKEIKQRDSCGTGAGDNIQDPHEFLEPFKKYKPRRHFLDKILDNVDESWTHFMFMCIENRVNVNKVYDVVKDTIDKHRPKAVVDAQSKVEGVPIIMQLGQLGAEEFGMEKTETPAEDQISSEVEAPENVSASPTSDPTSPPHAVTSPKHTSTSLTHASTSAPRVSTKASPTHASASPTHVSTSPTRLSTSPTRLSTSPTRVSTSPIHASTSATRVSASASPTHVTESPVGLPSDSPAHTSPTRVSESIPPVSESPIQVPVTTTEVVNDSLNQEPQNMVDDQPENLKQRKYVRGTKRFADWDKAIRRETRRMQSQISLLERATQKQLTHIKDMVQMLICASKVKASNYYIDELRNAYYVSELFRLAVENETPLEAEIHIFSNELQVEYLSKDLSVIMTPNQQPLSNDDEDDLLSEGKGFSEYDNFEGYDNEEFLGEGDENDEEEGEGDTETEEEEEAADLLEDEEGTGSSNGTEVPDKKRKIKSRVSHKIKILSRFSKPAAKSIIDGKSSISKPHHTPSTNDIKS